jgi:DNA-binding transcriptional LysR family regulator
VRGEADLAIRLRPLARAGGQRDLVTLASLDQGLAGFATRAYALTLPRGFTIADVAWIAWPAALDQVPPNPQLAARIPGFRPVFASDDFLVQLRAAEAGVGAIILGRFEHRFALPTPLVELDLDLGPFRSTIELVCARSALQIPRVKAVADLLATELGRVRTSSRASRSGRRGRPSASL